MVLAFSTKFRPIRRNLDVKIVFDQMSLATKRRIDLGPINIDRVSTRCRIRRGVVATKCNSTKCHGSSLNASK